jgi:site-specific DNA-methyltransferase (adenine-specific)
VLADPELSSLLTTKCREAGLSGNPKDWYRLLMRLRKAGKLVRLQTRKRTEFSWPDYDKFLFASEIAWSELREYGTLDDILCDPELAIRFDGTARRLAPGFTSLEYRWGALTLRKMSSKTRARSELFATLSLAEFHSKQLLRSWTAEKDILSSPGLYLVTGRSRQKIYVGGTLNLRNRLSTQFADGQLDEWETRWGAKSISLLRKPEVTDPIELLSMQRRLIELERPSLNDLGPTAA